MNRHKYPYEAQQEINKRTREDILEDIEYYIKWAEHYTKWAEEDTKWAEECTKEAEYHTKEAEYHTKWAEEAKQELKEFDKKEKGDE